MFLARIEGTVVAAVKHPTLDGCRFLVAQRLEADGSAGVEPIVVVDWLGAAQRLHGAGLHRWRYRPGEAWQQHAGAHGGGGHCGSGAGRRNASSGEAHETGHCSRPCGSQSGCSVVSRQDAGGRGAGDDGEPARQEWTGRRQGSGRHRRAGRCRRARWWRLPKAAKRRIHSGPMPCRWMRIVP